MGKLGRRVMRRPGVCSVPIGVSRECVIVNLVRSVLPDAYAAKARGFVLSAIALGAVYAYYLAVDADDAIPPAAAEVIAMPPVVRAASITSPIYIIPDATAHETPGPAAPPRAEIARDLQTALAKARCYDGPLTGRWSAASQAAMSAFLRTVNAHLPVDDPDEALLALVSSNSGVTCAAHPILVADAQDTRAAAFYDATSAQTKVAIATDAPASQTSGSVAATPSPSDDRSMLDHPWAQPEMLVPPVAMTPPTPAASSISTSSVERADRNAGQDASPASAVSAAEPPPVATVMKVSTAANDARGLRFEGGNVVSDEKPELAPAAQPTSVTTPAPSTDAAASTAKAAQRKTKSAKRKAARTNDSSFGVSFDSIQRSFSSLFD